MGICETLHPYLQVFIYFDLIIWSLMNKVALGRSQGNTFIVALVRKLLSVMVCHVLKYNSRRPIYGGLCQALILR